MSPFVAQVPVRWTDQDAFRHVNHAVAVTLLEEARIQLIFDAAAEAGVPSFGDGMVVTGLFVRYRRQIGYRSRQLRVTMTVHELRAASFRIGYEMHDGPDPDTPVAVTADTALATFDLAAQRPRRLTEPERKFLERWAV